MTEQIKIKDIRRDGGTQSRIAMNEETIQEYVEALKDNTIFPPITVFYDGQSYWLADGFHRVEAHDRAQHKTINADVKQGTRREAVLHSVGANSTHGLRRTQEDKRRAIMTLLEDDEWQQWSDREISRRCGVSPSTVSKYRQELSVQNGQITERKVVRNGTEYTMQVPQKPPPLDDVTLIEGAKVRYLQPLGLAAVTEMSESWEIAYSSIKQAYAKNAILLIRISQKGMLAFRDDAELIADALKDIEHKFTHVGRTYLIPFDGNPHYIELLKATGKNILYYSWVKEDVKGFWEQCIGESSKGYSLPGEPSNAKSHLALIQKLEDEKFKKGDTVRTQQGHIGIIESVSRFVTVTTANGTRDYKKEHLTLIEEDTWFSPNYLNKCISEMSITDTDDMLPSFLIAIRDLMPTDAFLKALDYRAGGDTSSEDVIDSINELFEWVRDIETVAQRQLEVEEVGA